MKTCFASLKRVTENRKQLERYARNRTEGILIDIYTNVALAVLRSTAC